MNCFLCNHQIAFAEVKSFSAVCMHDFKRGEVRAKLFDDKFSHFWCIFCAFWLRLQTGLGKADSCKIRCCCKRWKLLMRICSKLKWTESNWSKERLLMSIHSWSPSLSFLKEQLVNCDWSSNLSFTFKGKYGNKIREILFAESEKYMSISSSDVNSQNWSPSLSFLTMTTTMMIIMMIMTMLMKMIWMPLKI